MTAAYACSAATSRGRLHPEAVSTFRSPFQRDRDRIIHSSAFRRLKHKTQVFVEHEGDYYRTRLTHSIEVAQVARTIAGALDLDTDLAEAIALAHDLGHTPFGHTGEEILARLMAPWGGFDHNAQALRIVTRLERHYAGFDGLNLTWETLEGIAKHNGPFGGAPPDALPWALAEANAEWDLELATRAGPEAQVAAIADDIAYCHHDLHDGLRAGLIDESALVSLPLAGPALAEVARLHPRIDTARRRHEALRRVIGAMVEDVVATTRHRLAKVRPASPGAVRHLDTQIVGFSQIMAGDMRDLRAFLFEKVYRAPAVMDERARVSPVVADLFTLFLNTPGHLPEGWQPTAAEREDETTLARLVADYVAGMTDRFALQEHERLIGGARPVTS